MISIKRVENDTNMVSLHVTVSVERGSFEMKRFYCSNRQVADVLAGLSRLRENITSGHEELTLGSFIPNTNIGVGALHLSMYFNHRAELFISAHAQCLLDLPFDGQEPVTEAKFHFIRAPVDLDRFAIELQAVSAGHGDLAVL
jgi:hypothetical protein